MAIETITINLSPKVKREKHRGRWFLITDSTILKEGVFNGSQGPIFYSKEENEKSVDFWNGTPIVVNHPMVDGEPVSARQPKILEKYGIGWVFETQYADGLKPKLWFDEEDTKRVNNSIYKKLIAGEQIECSTGIRSANRELETEQVFNGLKYQKTAHNIRPDHLAILPDKKGACGIDHGCGVNNELSHRDIESQLRKALAARFTQDQPYFFIYEVFDTYFVYSQDDSLWRMDYTQTDTDVTLSTSDPVKVERITTYVSNGEMTVNESEKKQAIDFLVVNCAAYTEADRATLNAMEVNRLKQIHEKEVKNKMVRDANEAAKKGFTDPGGNTHTWNEATQKWDTKPASIPVAPPVNNAVLSASDQEALETARQMRDKEKTALISKLTVNVAAEKKTERVLALNQKTMKELRELEEMIGDVTPVADFSGGVPPLVTINSAHVEDTELLNLPVVDYRKKVGA